MEGKTDGRTAEADAGAAEVVDAEEVRVVGPAAAAQEVDHVDPPHLAPAPNYCPLVRVHDMLPFLPPLDIAVPSTATTTRTIRGNKEIDSTHTQKKPNLMRASTCARSLSSPAYLNRPLMERRPDRRCDRNSYFTTPYARGRPALRA
jgi:hypothetical protein